MRLDTSKLLGFRLIRSEARGQAVGAKIGETKPPEAVMGAKIGVIKMEQVIGAKIGGTKEMGTMIAEVRGRL